MADLNVNSIGDASGGNTATINGQTPTMSNMAGKNRIQNGDMRIDQRNAGASVTNDSADLKFAVDRTNIYGAVSSKFTAQQNAGSVTPPAGFSNYLGCTSSSAYTVGANENFWVQQKIEGYNVADLDWGTANAKTVTLSFWVRSSLTGTFGGSFQNSASNRSYPFTYTINTANTWEQKTVTVVGDTSGTWLTTNGVGIKVTWGLGIGSTYSGTAGSWAGANYNSATGATSVVGTSGATFYITGVQLEAGSVATPFEHVDYGEMLSRCQRYCEVIRPSGATTYAQIAIGQSYTTTAAQVGYFYQTAKRAQPAVTYDTASKYVLLNASDGAVACSSIQTGRSDVTSLAINAVVGSSTFTAGHANRLLSNNTEIPVTIISAEL